MHTIKVAKTFQEVIAHFREEVEPAMMLFAEINYSRKEIRYPSGDISTYFVANSYNNVNKFRGRNFDAAIYLSPDLPEAVIRVIETRIRLSD